MTSAFSQRTDLTIRPFQYRDLEAIASLSTEGVEAECQNCVTPLPQQLQKIRRWYGPLKFLTLFPNPLQHLLSIYVGEQNDALQGMIQVAPFNRTRSTWRVDRIAIGTSPEAGELGGASSDVGSSLLRYCFEKIWEARTWLIELDVNDKTGLALYRQNGFQPLAQNTYWTIPPESLERLALREPDLPNLRPVSNADAPLLHQLDTASMPPLVRQVFDRHVVDFKTGLMGATVESIKHWVNRSDVIERYVFEPQRKAAIGYFRLQLSLSESQTHTAQLTVHPAYTWLYAELLAQMARFMQGTMSRGLKLVSSDYQPEREEYLEQIGAERTEHTLLMSRSVWHKLRETRPVSLEALQLSEVLQGFQPTRKPVPGRFAMPSPFSTPSSYAQPTSGDPSPKPYSAPPHLSSQNDPSRSDAHGNDGHSSQA